jgi:glycosyltransferase involved in cell wall biosynthesis
MAVAVVASGYGDAWSESHVLARRLAGALACATDVDILAPGETGIAFDGAVRLVRFPATPHDPARRAAWRRALFGRRENPDPFACSCVLAGAVANLPSLGQEELVRAEGGDSPALYDHLRRTPYDLVVFVDHHSPATTFGVRALPDDRPMALVPAATDAVLVGLPIHQEAFDRSRRILVSTESELTLLSDRLDPSVAGRAENVGFVFGVNTLAQRTEPRDYDEHPFITVVADWTKVGPVHQLSWWAERMRRELDVKLYLVGPRADAVPNGLRLTASRLDVWRWVTRSVALLDPWPHRLIGRDVLESLLLGVPVLVHAHGGATREHAEVGNGGLWYRTDEELCAATAALLDEPVRKALGEQGRTYAEERYRDSDSYVKRVVESLGL